MSDDKLKVQFPGMNPPDPEDEAEPEVKFFKVLKDADLAEGQGRVVRAGLKKIALFRRDGKLFAIQDFCPHAGGSLGSGEFIDGVVKCPRHGWGFDVETGACLTNALYQVRRYPTRVEGDDILVGVPEDGALI